MGFDMGVERSKEGALPNPTHQDYEEADDVKSASSQGNGKLGR